MIIFAIPHCVKGEGDSLRAFPGAAGFGAYTKGGRHGKIIIVTNLNDTGPGSFREACERKGPRTVVFKVNGIIELKKDIYITHPFITIAGQSAPGNGIMLRGASFIIQTSEVIIRNIRFRPGYTGKQIDGLSILADGTLTGNIIIDHCSFQWASDENVGINGRNGGLRNITIQNCIIAEGLLKHSMGLLVNKHVEGFGVRNISVLFNLFAHNHERNPLFGHGTTGEVVGNIIYNWRIKASGYDGESCVNVIDNVFIPGPSTQGITRTIQLNDKPTLYLKGNVGPVTADSIGVINFPDSLFTRKTERLNSSGIVSSKGKLDAFVLEVGAQPIDEIDRRIINNVLENTGSIITRENEVGGWPSTDTGNPLKDSDSDGIPDDWEVKNGLNPQDPSDAPLTLNGNQYSNIEIYLNQLIPLN